MKQSLLLTVQEMARVTGGEWRNLPEAPLNITGVNFNPRRVTKGDLFIVHNWKALDGADSEDLVESAIRQGEIPDRSGWDRDSVYRPGFQIA